MRLEGARRPGLDALVAIADGMEVSIDWLVGRSVYSFPVSATEKDYALACFAVVSALLNWLRKQQAKGDGSVFESELVAGVPDAEVAANSMYMFIERMKMFRNSQGDLGMSRNDVHDRIDRLPSSKDGTGTPKVWNVSVRPDRYPRHFRGSGSSTFVIL